MQKLVLIMELTNDLATIHIINIILQHSSSQYETPVHPISHSIRRSLNLENLSLLDKSCAEENKSNDSNDVYSPASDIVGSELGSKKQHVSHQNEVHQNHENKLVMIKSKRDVTSASDDVTSPTSTVSSCRTSNGPFTLGQNTYNSADSSGYNTSSTMDVAEHPEILKNSLNCNLAMFGRKQKTNALERPVDNQTGKRIDSSNFDGERINLSRVPTIKVPDSLDLKSTPQTDSLCQQPPVNVTSSPPNSAMPIPAPRAVYPPSHTPSPSTAVPEGSNPWQHKTHVTRASPNCPTTYGFQNQQTSPVFVKNSPCAIHSPRDLFSPQNPQVANRGAFASESSSRIPVNNFDILPTNQLASHERILKEGELNI